MQEYLKYLSNIKRSVIVCRSQVKFDTKSSFKDHELVKSDTHLK